MSDALTEKATLGAGTNTEGGGSHEGKGQSNAVTMQGMLGPPGARQRQ